MANMSWKEISEVLTSFILVSLKEQTQMYNFWQFNVVKNKIHRCRDDAVALHGLVLDYDNNLTLNDALETFFGFECVVYTTFNHGPNKDKFRIVLPFANPISKEQFIAKRQSMIEAFPGADRASFSISQAIFLHSGPDKALAFSCRLDGDMLDPTIFADEVVEPIVFDESRGVDLETDPEFKLAYKAAVIESLRSCSGIRHLNSLSVVVILKSCGGTFSDYQQIVEVAGAHDSCIRDIKSQTESWAAVSNDALIGKKKRDEFIVKFGGNPVVVKYKKPISTLVRRITELKRKIENAGR